MHSLTSFFSTELFWTSLKWFMIVAIWAFSAWGVYKGERQMKMLSEKTAYSPEIIRLVQILSQRNIQMWVVVSVLLIVVMVSDLRHEGSTYPADIPTAASEPAALPAVAAEIPVTPTTQEAPVKPLSAATIPFSDITEFNEKDSKQQAYIDLLKERYEGWLVTYYYLQKCGNTGAQDLVLIENALQKELTTAHGSAMDESNIILAAKGSYDEMYHDIPCDNEHLSDTKASYDTNMQQIKKVIESPAGSEITAIKAVSTPAR